MALIIDVDHTFRRAAREMGVISRQVRSRVLKRASNRGIRKFNTEAKRGVAARFAIAQKVVARGTRLKLASQKGSNVDAEAIYRGARIPLNEFKPKAVNPYNVRGRKRRRGGGGVSVRVTRSGGRKLISNAFLATARSGKQLVLRRVSKGGVVRSRKPKKMGPPGRYPIVELTTVSVPGMVVSRDVYRRASREGITAFRREMWRQFERIWRKR